MDETYSTHIIIYTSYKWKFRLHENTECVIGLIDVDITGKQNMNEYININTELINISVRFVFRIHHNWW